MDTLPPELMNAIIDHLVSEGVDKSSLSACALVSRSWLPTSRYHLFKSIHIYHDDTVDPEVPGQFPLFVNFVEQTPHIGGFIQSLTLEWTNGSTNPTDCLLLDDNNYFGRLLTSLHFLRDLELDYVKLGFASRIINPGSFSLRNLKLSRLRLGYARDPFQELITFLALFSRIQQLQILDANFGHRDPAESDFDPPPIVETLFVENLKLSTERIRLFLPAYSKILQKDSLRDLDILPNSLDDLPSIGTLLQTAGPTLHCFRFSVPGVDEEKHPQTTWRALGLSHCASLETLVFEVFTENTLYDSIAWMFVNVLNILESNQPYSIVELILEGIVGTSNKDIINSLPNFAWNSFDDHLHDKYPQLRVIRFHFTDIEEDPNYPDDEVQRPMMDETQYVLDHLPRCRRKGLLQCILEGPAVFPNPRVIV